MSNLAIIGFLVLAGCATVCPTPEETYRKAESSKFGADGLTYEQYAHCPAARLAEQNGRSDRLRRQTRENQEYMEKTYGKGFRPGGPDIVIYVEGQ